ncbi:hypothetical protein [Anaeromicrobium sediminis]|uniref:Uncharacterized protein n=1 Tax=Anaeromicrobium sediminis TaxID=1478221 RepID=A0A267MCT1_9FIRM|nr:hypothetical protein [Anaeromicrobium sediminis]PAB57391.1 hypothetical protein CCE28_19025 [Anaeromicrobium sediminis]
MKKNKLLIFTRILYILFAIGTIIVFWMVYKDIDSSFAFKFGIGYVFLTFFLLLYVPFVTILNLRKLKWVEIRRRVIKFIGLFISFGTLNYIFDYVFRPSNIDLFREFSSGLGLAFGISFIDVTFFKKKES